MDDLKEVVLQKDVETFVRSVAQILKLKDDKTEMSRDEKIKLTKALAAEGEDGRKAREQFGASRAALMLPLLPTQSTVRNIYTVDPLPAGANPSYPISFIDVPFAYIAPTLSGPAVQVVQGDELWIPQLKMQGYVEFPSQFAADGRYSIVEASSNALKNSMIAKEEYVGWRVAKATISGVRADQTLYTGGISAIGNLFGELTVSGISLAMTRMEQMGRNLTQLHMTPLRKGNIRTWTTVQIDYDTQREIIKAGGLAGGRIFGDVTLNTVRNTTLINDGEVFGFDTNRFGVMAITREMVTRDDPMAFTRDMVGTHAFSTMGFACMDPWAIVRIRLDND